MNEQSYEEDVLAELKAIRIAMENGSGKLDMLAMIDKKLENGSKMPRRPINLFTILGLQDVPVKWRIGIILAIPLLVTGHYDTLVNILRIVGLGA